ncbi:MAG: hypothetical protein KKF56_03140 [Nanoarchaeota archaeon]|nr:hypothetical protein [Nanoarchaeota archaeon]
MKKWILCLLIIGILPLISAVEITKTSVTDTIIKELNNPAIYNLEITNHGEYDEFNIYNLIGITLQPSSPFSILRQETKQVELKVYPNEFLLGRQTPYSFVYKVRGKNTNITDDILTVKIVSITDAFLIKSKNIHLNSTSATLKITNLQNFQFNNITLDFNSKFFSEEETISLEPYEKKEIIIPIERANLRGLSAGDYKFITTVKLPTEDKEIQSTLTFTEKADITKKEESSGIIIHTTEITKSNEGNLPITVDIQSRKNIISRLLTSFNIDPTKTERQGFFIEYTWQKQLEPGDSLEVEITTNWIIPLFIIIFILIIIAIYFLFFSANLILKKSAHLMRTKGGEFALKITLRIKSRKYIEKITLADRFPHLLKLHSRYLSQPEKVDLKNNRLLWNITQLSKGETRIFTYIVYSKVGVVGRFEIPQATAIYEANNKVHETYSNKAYFVGEQKHEEKF